MFNLTAKQKIIALILALGAALIFIFQQGLYGKPSSPTGPKTEKVQSEEPQVVSTSPNPLQNGVILPTQTVEITFNQPVENLGELKYKIDPQPEGFTIELSSDRKTVKIIPTKPFRLGTFYSFFIEAGESGTKFDGNKRLKENINFSFKTIDFKGS